MKSKTKVKTKVYFDPKEFKFRTIRGVTHNGFIVSHPTDFYCDAKTTTAEEVVNEKIFESLIAVDDIESFPNMEKIDLGSDGIHIWSYMAVKFPDIKKMTKFQLEALLNSAVDREDYEKASEIRDLIKMKL